MSLALLGTAGLSMALSPAPAEDPLFMCNSLNVLDSGWSVQVSKLPPAKEEQYAVRLYERKGKGFAFVETYFAGLNMLETMPITYEFASPDDALHLDIMAAKNMSGTLTATLRDGRKLTAEKVACFRSDKTRALGKRPASLERISARVSRETARMRGASISPASFFDGEAAGLSR